MITKEELRKYSKNVGLENLGQAEKDYFQVIILFILHQSYGKTLVFKGGTALKKCYGLNRFSEDLDFTCESDVDLRKLEDGLKRFNINYEIESKKYENGLKVILRLEGPLYTGIRFSLCKFIIDFSFRENVILKPEVKTIGRFLEEIPQFDVVVMNEKEIVAEKVRAIMSRTKARDVYDLWFLLNRGAEFDLALIKEKLKYYNETWSPENFHKHMNLKRTIWRSELENLVNNVPDFNEVKKFIVEKIEKEK